MKKIPLQRIPEDVGLDVDFSNQDPWVMDVLLNLLTEEGKAPDHIGGQVHIDLINDNVSINGKIAFTHYPNCARCGIPLVVSESMPIKALMAPLYTSGEDREKHEEDEVELTKDDMDFSFYEKDEIVLDSLLNDDIAMQLSYNYYCKEDCKGLCLVCKQNLNEGTCSCQSAATSLRWESLKNLNFPKK